jgi:succinoglycan biosynthesis transport protein ExoP
MELLTGRIDLQQAVGQECATGLTLLPLVLNEQLVHSDEILSSQAFRNLIDPLRQGYDYIIMDLPPSLPLLTSARVYRLSIHSFSWCSGEAQESRPCSVT